MFILNGEPHICLSPSLPTRVTQRSERRTGTPVEVLGSPLRARGGQEPGQGEQSILVLRQVPSQG